MFEMRSSLASPDWGPPALSGDTQGMLGIQLLKFLFLYKIRSKLPNYLLPTSFWYSTDESKCFY